MEGSLYNFKPALQALRGRPL
jgi:hypothetical protein